MNMKRTDSKRLRGLPCPKNTLSIHFEQDLIDIDLGEEEEDKQLKNQ